SSSLVFFFQTEDGIRDRTVTGVQTCALPICSLRGCRLRSFGEAVDALRDGVASTPEAAAPEAAAIAARTASLSRRETAEGDERLLAFLYLRTERVLTPVADWRDERIYRYPLADALGRPGEDSFLMLERLRR